MHTIAGKNSGSINFLFSRKGNGLGLSRHTEIYIRADILWRIQMRTMHMTVIPAQNHHVFQTG